MDDKTGSTQGDREPETQQPSHDSSPESPPTPTQIATIGVTAGASHALTEENLVIINLATARDSQSDISTEVGSEAKGPSSNDWVVIPRERDREQLAARLMREPKFEQALSNQEQTTMSLDEGHVDGRPATTEDVRDAIRLEESIDSLNAEPPESRNMSTSSLLSISERCQCYCVSAKGMGAQFH